MGRPRRTPKTSDRPSPAAEPRRNSRAIGLETRGQIGNVNVERRGDRTALAAGEWLAESARGGARAPFFIWLHLYDPHDPYDPPAPFHDAFADRPYDGEIAFDDAVVGSILENERASEAITIAVLRHNRRLWRSNAQSTNAQS